MQPLHPHLPAVGNDQSHRRSTQMGTQLYSGPTQMDLSLEQQEKTQQMVSTQRMIQNARQGNINVSGPDQCNNNTNTFTGNGVFPDGRIDPNAPVMNGSGVSLPSLPVLGGLAKGRAFLPQELRAQRPQA